MLKTDLNSLCAISLCDAVAEKLEASENFSVEFSNAPLTHVEFTEAKISEIRILGYEVLDENEEVLFDMPDVEILGDKIPDALAALNQSRPHAVEFTQEDGFAVLTLADNTDTYKIQIDFKEIFSE